MDNIQLEADQLLPRNDSDDARIGYQVAVSLMTYEGNLIWTRFAAMLIAHTIIFTGLGLTFNTLGRLTTFVQFGLSSVGLLLCFVWWTLNQRGFDYYKYWILSARELEERFLAPSVQTLSRGGHFAGGNNVAFRISGGNLDYRARRSARMTVANAVKGIVVVFTMAYVIALVMATLT